MSRLTKMHIGTIYVELTNVCNFNCTFCTNDIMTRKKGMMEFELAKRIIDEISETKLTSNVIFFIMGEPLLHPQAIKIFDYALQKGLRVSTSTNCSLLTDEVIRKLYGINIDKLVLSLETPTDETFKMRRTNYLSFDTCLKQIQNTVRQKYEKGANTILDILISRDVLSDTSEIKEIVRAWKKFAEGLTKEYNLHKSSDNISVSSRHFDFKRAINKLIYRKGLFHNWKIEILPGTYLELARSHNWGNIMIPNNSKVIKAKIGSCNALQEMFGIFWNGDCTLCCLDFDGKLVFDSVKKKSLKEILSSPKAQRIRHNFKRCILTESSCKVCRGGTTIRSWLFNQFASCLLYHLPKYQQLRKWYILDVTDIYE